MSRDWAFERMEQLICDEGRLITYKILSSDLKIHVNKAKQYLLEYFQNHSKENCYDAHFFLAGLQEDSAGLQSFKLCLVSHDKLEKAKEDFKSVTSCHIYSVIKGKVLDENILYTVDQNEDLFDHEHKFSSIKHSSVKVQPRVTTLVKKETATSNAVAKVPKKEEPKQPQKNSGITSMFKKNESKDQKTKTESTDVPKDKESSKVEANKNKKISPQKKNSNGTSLLSMWQKKEEKSEKVVSKKPAKEKKSPPGPSNNLMKMFSKQSEKQAANAKTAPKEISPKKQEIEVPKLPKSEKKSPEKKNVTKPSKHSRVIKTSQKNKRTKAKIGSDSEDEFQPQKKKHRRIMTFDDSDSESECEEEQDKAQRDLCNPESPLGTSAPMEAADDDEDSEEPIPPTPPVNAKKANQLTIRTTPTQKGKSKVLKTVVKHYEDEDGFLVTKKEKELVSASEDSDGEDPISSKSEKVIKEDTKISFFTKKQASLTSFFKQK